MLLRKLLSATAILLSACASKQVPEPPPGELYSIFAPEKKLLCAKVPGGDDCQTITVDEADKFYCMSPDYWMQHENYIDELIALLKNGLIASSAGGVLVKAEDIQAFKDDMWHMRKTLEWKRKKIK